MSGPMVALLLVQLAPAAGIVLFPSDDQELGRDRARLEIVRAADGAMARAAENGDRAELAPRGVAGAVNRCAGEAACLARIGQRLGASRVIAGRAAAAGDGVALTFAVIDVATAYVAREVILDIPRRSA